MRDRVRESELACLMRVNSIMNSISRIGVSFQVRFEEVDDDDIEKFN